MTTMEISTQQTDDALAQLVVPQRERLPDTRLSVTHKFSVAGQEGYLIVGLYADGRPAEVFIRMAKSGSTVRGLMDTIGVLTSLALQHGVSVDALARKFEGTKFEPAGTTHNDRLREARSLTDYIFRWLGLEFSAEYRAHCRNQANDTTRRS